MEAYYAYFNHQRVWILVAYFLVDNVPLNVLCCVFYHSLQFEYTQLYVSVKHKLYVAELIVSMAFTWLSATGW